MSFLSFAVNLTDVSGTMLTSTATLTNATVDLSVILVCADGVGSSDMGNIAVGQGTCRLNKFVFTCTYTTL